MTLFPEGSALNVTGSMRPGNATLSLTSQSAATGLTPLYDRQYITLHNLLEKEMRNRVESEKMIRNDMTQIQEGMARICNQIQEVATDLKGNLPRLFQETKELRRDTQQLSMAYNQNSSELNRLHELMIKHKAESDQNYQTTEQRMHERGDQDKADKNAIWNKLCPKTVVQDLADKVGCMDMEAHAKFLERRREHEDAISKIGDLERKVQQSLDEFLRGINKCDYLYSQCNNANLEFKKAAEKVTDDHKEMIDNIVFPRIERCEGLLNQEMCERVDCLKKIAHELVHSKEQNDKVRDHVERLAVDLCTTQAASAFPPGNGNTIDSYHRAAANSSSGGSGTPYHNGPFGGDHHHSPSGGLLQHGSGGLLTGLTLPAAIMSPLDRSMKDGVSGGAFTRAVPAPFAAMGMQKPVLPEASLFAANLTPRLNFAALTFGANNHAPKPPSKDTHGHEGPSAISTAAGGNVFINGKSYPPGTVIRTHVVNDGKNE